MGNEREAKARLPLSPPPTQGSVAGSRAFRAPLRRGRLAVRPVGERRKAWRGLRGPPCANQETIR